MHDLSFWSNVTMVDGVRGGPWGSVVRDDIDNFLVRGSNGEEIRYKSSITKFLLVCRLPRVQVLMEKV